VRKRVYIAGPISKGDLAHNINQATAAFVALAKAGLAPLCPHWSVYAKPAIVGPAAHLPHEVWCKATVDGSPGMSHDDWIGVDLPWVIMADAVVRLPGESSGADIETGCARDHGVPVFDSVEACVAWATHTGGRA